MEYEVLADSNGLLTIQSTKINNNLNQASNRNPPPSPEYVFWNVVAQLCTIITNKMKFQQEQAQNQQEMMIKIL